ncbi:MAG TPA: DUF6006 family protein [Oligoflexus sp.]|uniref:DUF6006 family protein n=1 Tax=Oligoflexus sp. TaxID=1971216 RepID=UPI002D37D7A6|nr:DUF6006 family protein [Oligoflexus sp.]HYX35660.1 DUF6006 family protein [Oligoflexus sp.]
MYRSAFLALPLLSMFASSSVSASQIVRQWYHGWWDCNIDGRPAQMVWEVVDDPQTKRYPDGTCSTTSAVKTVGWFSDNGAPWVHLGINNSSGTYFGIRYLGQEQDNWYLIHNPADDTATGKTTWRGQQYPLSCWNHRR